MNMSKTAIEKPNKGENRRASPILTASAQFTEECVVFSGKVENTSPTPKIAPTKVCELEHGIPKYHVPKFQTIAPQSTAIIMHTA